MKRLILGALAIFTTSMVGAANAADMPIKAPMAPPPVCVWCGFYVGGDVGAFEAMQNASTTAFPSPGFGFPGIAGAGTPGFGVLPTAHILNSTSALGGLHAGWNWQPTANWLLGVEGDYMWLDRGIASGAQVIGTFPGAPPPNGSVFVMNTSASNNHLASARARVGWGNDHGMLYATGGAAWTNTTYATNVMNTVAAATPINAGAGLSDSRVGWVAGGGIEIPVMSNWFLRAEYLHYAFSGNSYVLPLVIGAGAAPYGPCAPGLCNWNVSNGKLTFDTVRLGISYKIW